MCEEEPEALRGVKEFVQAQVAGDQLVRVTARIDSGLLGLTLNSRFPFSPFPLAPRSSRSLWSFPPQVSIRLDGENKAVEYNAVGAMKDAVRVVFRGSRVNDLFDRDWHKMALSIQAQNVSLHIDCALVQTLPIEERENIDIQGKTVIGKRLYDSVPIDVSTTGPSAAQVPGHRGEALGAKCPQCSPHLHEPGTKSSPWTVLEGKTLTQKTAILEPQFTITHVLTHSVIQPFHQSFITYTLSTYYVPGTVPGSGQEV